MNTMTVTVVGLCELPEPPVRPDGDPVSQGCTAPVAHRVAGALCDALCLQRCLVVPVALDSRIVAYAYYGADRTLKTHVLLL